MIVMNTTFHEFKFSDSRTRMERAIQRLNEAVVECDSIKESISEENSKYQTAYVYATVLSIAINTNTKWENVSDRANLSIGYKALFTEIIAILKSSHSCKAYYVDGTHMIAVFETPMVEDFKPIVDICAKISSVVDIWNFLRKDTPNTYSCVIGAHYGRVLMFNSNCSVHDVDNTVFLGMAMQKANQLCYMPVQNTLNTLVRVSSVFFENLSADYKRLFKWSDKQECYQTSIYNVEMKQWLKQKEENSL